MRAIAAVVFVSIAAILSSAGTAQSGRIDSIDPASARAGEAVTITGIGFGALNLQITVGGIPAKITSATGSKATFLIPKDVKPGLTTVARIRRSMARLLPPALWAACSSSMKMTAGSTR